MLEKIIAQMEQKLADIDELIYKRDEASTKEFRNAYQVKITEKTKEYNTIVEKIRSI